MEGEVRDPYPCISNHLPMPIFVLLTMIVSNYATYYHESKVYLLDSKENKMNFRVHHLEVKRDNAQEKLERFLNQLDGEVISVVPYTSPTFQGMGATSEVDFLLIVEKIK